MSKRLSAQEIAAIRERVERATPGNWHATLDDPYDRTYVLGAFNGVITVVADIKGDADASFIAHAREDVPALIGEIIRLRAVLADIAVHNAPDRMAPQGYDIVRLMARQAFVDEPDTLDVPDKNAVRNEKRLN